ncbi:MAG TPA: ATP-binding protein, partial [Candidatus Saccharimonadales bacterium]|nr:ATP-binding protein [Candidatus Saccharimonadales bacterium]
QPESMIALRDPDIVPAGAGLATLTSRARSASGREEVVEACYPVFTRRGTRSNEEIGFLLEEKAASDSRLEAIGNACVVVSMAATYAEMRQLYTGLGLLTTGIIAMGVLVTILLVRIVVKPIRSLVAATRRIAAGDLGEVVESESRDELGELAVSFNLMTGELRRSRQERENYSAELERQVRIRSKELEEAQSQLVQAEKMSAVGLLVSGVAHELNNPLAGVVGFSQLLLKEDVAERVRRGLERINKEAERCKKIVQNLQTFARKHKPEKDYIGINGILESCIDLRAYQLRVDNIKVVADLDPALPKTMADFHQLQQVFINIMVNAQQAMVAQSSGGTLTLRTRTDGGQIRVEMRDSGPGIPEEILPRLFDPFFTTKEVGQGTGLGLSICYGIIEEHRGRIYARNAPDGGAIFVVEIPVIAAEEKARPQAPELDASGAEEPLRPANILVVDDELTIIDILFQVLKADGHRVDTALSGTAALRKIERERYDVIISDLKMPGMSGQQLYEQVRRRDEALARRIVFSTGDTVSDDTRSFLESSGNRYLQKPFELDTIRRIVLDVLRLGVLESAPARS